jgi:hypothetical protein
MNSPICKLCESRHWLDEEHKPGPGLDKVRELGAVVLGYEKRIVVFPDPNPPEAVTIVAGTDEMMYVPANVPTETVVPTPDVPTCENCHKRPREGRYKSCSACRKRAYRERSRDVRL